MADQEAKATAPTEEKPKDEGKAKAKADKTEDVTADLSEEDRALKDSLELCVQRLLEPDASLHHSALETLRTTIRSSTSSMTAVPKPLKFLRPHFDKLKQAFETIADPQNKAFASDIVSLVAMTVEDGKRECLKYRLTGSTEAMESWGHEYVRHLAGEISDEFKERTEADPPQPVADLMELVTHIIPYDMSHNAEADACDLAMEVERLDLLEEHVTLKSYERVGLYLLSAVPFVPEPEDDQLKCTCLALYRKFAQWPQAMQMALKIGTLPTIVEVFTNCKDQFVRRQLAFMLARQQIVLDLDEILDDVDDEEKEVLRDLMANKRLNQSFLALARELDIMEPKTPDDIYKTHLETGRSSTATVDSARANLAATFVNAFVNAGFAQDKLILAPGQGNKWFYKNKDDGMMSAAASMGMLLLWDVEGGLTRIDPFLQVHEDHIKAGSLLALGIVNCGVRDENEPALALLSDLTTHATQSFRVGSCMGLGLAYAGSANAAAGEALRRALANPASTMEVLGVSALALGQVYAGTCDGEITQELMDVILARSPADLADPYARYLALGLGLVYLGKQQAAEVVLQALVTLPGSFGKVTRVLVEACAYAATGNVLKVQEMLHLCSEHFDTTAEGAKDSDAHQAFATLAIAMIAMGEEIGADMALRSFNHLLQYGEPVIRRAVPIAVAQLCISNPKLPVLDTLSKLSHDPDAETAYGAILALGLVGAGTNHARIGGMLRTLAQFYHKDANALFVVRLAQGILHTGKGSITLSPFHTDRTLMSPVSVAGMLAILVSALDFKNILLKTGHYMLFHAALAMYPRILCTFHDDADLTPVSTSVRVGNAVDAVGQAGKPKTITGFVTNTTPVLLGYGERAQLATDEYLPLTPILEGFVLVKRNPEFVQTD